MTLRVFNTLSGEKELFEPLTPGKVGMYLCGPTVYKPAHIGHAVGPIIFDVVKRYLMYKGFDVTWVVNITDVEDKLIAEAQRQGRDMLDLARELEERYVANISALGVRGIDHLPRASEHIQEIIDQTKQLVEKDYAYAADGDVYFDVSRDDDYGKLTNRKADEQESGTREGLVSTNKRNPGDFALWKHAKDHEPASVKYDSPWGSGRPGWHIECSAMAMKYLGATFDIHGGGMDLKFPHHENELAQAESANDQPFSKYWMHHGLTRFNTKKISKSDPEMARIMSALQIDALLEKHDWQLLRFLILKAHYRSPIDFSDEALAAAKTGLETFTRLFERIERICKADPYTSKLLVEKLRGEAMDEASAGLFENVLQQRVRFLEAMDDDFNTAQAIAVLFDIANAINKFIEATRLETNGDTAQAKMALGACGSLTSMGHILGLFETRPAGPSNVGDEKTPQLVDLLVEVRRQVREAKQYAIGDHIRDELTNLGITLEDSKDGTRWRME